MSGFVLLGAALFIMVVCIVLCVAYISYKFKEARRSVRLIDADFPFNVDGISKKQIKNDEDLYNKPTSDARLLMSMFYTSSDMEGLRRKASPNRLPKGRNKV